ncbi:MAG: NAD-glutamate dehydrogenase [Myxococcales bacterium]|nr:NAD-glutamate dehydrogenase [Myxococcales bacterium]
MSQPAGTLKRHSHRDDRRNLMLAKLEASELWDDESARRQALFMGTSVVRRADDDFLNRHPADDVPAHVAQALAAVQVVPRGTVSVGCSVPTVNREGYDLHMVSLETCMADQPFVVDTIKLVLRRLGVRILGTLNMILPVLRDGEGNLVDMGADVEGGKNESFTCHLLSLPTAQSRTDEIRTLVRDHLERAQRVVRDFRPIRKLVRDVSSTLTYAVEAMPARERELNEVASFCDWLLDDHFVFMGAYGFDTSNRPTGRLGLGTYDPKGTASCGTDPTIAFDDDAPIITIHQSRLDSPVHRDARMQEIRIRLFDEDGDPDGGIVFQGLFTYAALTHSASRVPVMRARLTKMAVNEDLVPRSHRMKLFRSFFDRVPLTYTFASTNREIQGLINEAIDVDFGGVPRVHCSYNANRTVAHAFVIVTRDRYGDRLRWQVQQLIRREFEADHVEFRLLVGKTDAAMWHYLLQSETELKTADLDTLSDQVEAIVSPWIERMRDMLRDEGESEQDIDRNCVLYGDSLPRDYCARVEARHLVEDLHAFERVHAGGQIQIALRQDAQDRAEGVVRLLSFGTSDTALTDILPIIDHFGLRVLGESTSRLIDADGRELYFERYRIDLSADQGAAVLDHGDALIDAIGAVLDGRSNSSSLNSMLLPARLTWRHLNVLRAYIGYARQLGTAFPPNVVQRALHDNAAIARTLIDLFDARFEPYLGETGGHLSAAKSPRRAVRIEKISERFVAQLEGVSDVVTDKVLRMYFNLISSTIRTNYFALNGARRALSFKFRCADVELMPDPRPLYEIWVYDPRIEGVHLRGGPVARGGLRWSDRVDDFRTEVLGLMLTQQVKNTLIVPVGSKGGFVLKGNVGDDQERRRRADELYKVFIHGLLDVTDNIIGDKVVYPVDVVVHDGPDPYLVVAADKGTAHLSDTANSIAIERGFWLGDAFASGGSQGYDHKLYGITAKGAWVCVQRHFREMGMDTQKDEFTCVGIGDMSGDVFGNGLLLSKTTKLIGAFNHRHIFLDPTPEPASSWEERKRLFDLPRSSWSDYDTDKLSEGGGVFARGAKRIELTPQVQQALGATTPVVSGDELVQFLLRADVHLLWNGGIGTYVKASHETHLDAGDKANDAVRINATQLRCKAVGEGGNLGFTHAARVEFALRGGRINTDAVDNSAGVDLSDHEVNLKILFARLLAAKKLTMPQRDEVLFAIDQQVCDAVLGDNYQHSLALSVEESTAPQSLRAWERTIAFLAEKLGIDRDLQDLPSAETVRERRHANLGLTRPELARVHAFAKMWVYNELTADPNASRHVADHYLNSYFPAEVTTRFSDAIVGHKLRHEIVCMVWGNEIVDYGGALLLPTLAVEVERPVADLCNAYALAAEVLGATSLRAAINGLDGSVQAQAQYDAIERVENVLAGATRAILARYIDTAALSAAMEGRSALCDLVASVTPAIHKALKSQKGGEITALARQWESRGIPRDLARRLARLDGFTHLVWIADLAETTSIEPQRAVQVWFSTAHVTGLGALIGLQEEAASSRWIAAARASLRQDLCASMLRLSRRVAEGIAPTGALRRSSVRKLLSNGGDLSDVWALARQVPSERDQIAAQIVLTTRLRSRIGA